MGEEWAAGAKALRCRSGGGAVSSGHEGDAEECRRRGR